MKFGEKELRVIDIAEKLFADKGYDATSVRDIAKEASGNVSLVSYYFGSKENLLLAIFERRSEDIKSHISHLLENNDLTDLQKINIFIDEFMLNLERNKDLHKLLIREELFNRDPEIFSMIHNFKKKNLAMIENILLHGVETGEFNKDINIPFLMATLVGTATQSVIGKEFYAKIGATMPICSIDAGDDILKTLSAYLKNIFKIVLTAR